jgi:hypothetical protein
VSLSESLRWRTPQGEQRFPERRLPQP